jgi:TfoX/Sxy family transcriptional regulator of competence genes
MSYDAFLAERMTRIFYEKNISFEAKKMMGGLCYMVDDKMCAGIYRNKVMARIDPEIYDMALKKEGCQPLDITGQSMKGFVLIEQEAVDMDTDLEYWINLCLEFNPRAKSSKKKKK